MEPSRDLIALAYATATDRSSWKAFCDALTGTTSVATLLFGHDIEENRSLGIIGGGLDPAEVDRYHRDFADKNPWMHMDVRMPMGTVGISDQALSRTDLFKTEFYNGWLRYQDNIVGGSCLICYRSDSQFVALACGCRAREADDTIPQSSQLLQSLAPHIAHAIRMGEVFGGGDSTSRALLEASRHAVIVLRRSGRVGFQNAAARRFLSRASELRISDSRRLAASSEPLRGFLRAAVAAVGADSGIDLPVPQVLSTVAFGTCVAYAHLFPAQVDTGFPGSAWTDEPAGAIVIASLLDFEHSSSAERLARAFGATPAEARLAGALCAGVSLGEYAQFNGLSQHTVRNQMRALLHKTGSSNQADFVRRTHRLASPFDDQDL